MNDIFINMIAKTKSWTKRVMKAMFAHYMNLSQDDLFVLINMFKKKAKARTFALMRSKSLRRE